MSTETADIVANSWGYFNALDATLWATARDKAAANGIITSSMRTRSYNWTPSQYWLINRSPLVFGLDEYDPDGTVNSAKIKIWFTTEQVYYAASSGVAIVGDGSNTNPTANRDVNDYDRSLYDFENPYAKLNSAQITTGHYEEFVLDAAGIAQVQAALGGNAAFMAVSVADQEDEGGNMGSGIYNLYIWDDPNDSNPPILEFDYTAPPEPIVLEADLEIASVLESDLNIASVLEADLDIASVLESELEL